MLKFLFPKRVSTLRSTLAALCVALAPLHVTVAQERIEQFDAVVRVQSDASLDVVETIMVTAEGNKIKRGIYRDFPTISQDRQGRSLEVGFTVLGVQRDGVNIPYELKDIRFGKRVYLGAMDAYLTPHQRYTYTLHYTTTRQVGQFDTYDEIYWNVTGDQWEFPIMQATATIYPPAGAGFLGQAFYTGKHGEKGKDASVSGTTEGALAYVTTRPLSPREGLTVAASWPKGFVTAPPPQYVEAPAPSSPWLLLVGSGASIIVYLIMWRRVGRDPQRGTIIPLFTPPTGISPSLASAMLSMHYQYNPVRTFTTGLIALAVKQRIFINQKNGEFSVTENLACPDNAPPLSEDELALSQGLFAPSIMQQPTMQAFQRTGAPILSTIEGMANAAFSETVTQDANGAHTLTFDRHSASHVRSLSQQHEMRLQTLVQKHYYRANMLAIVRASLAAVGLPLAGLLLSVDRGSVEPMLLLGIPSLFGAVGLLLFIRSIQSKMAGIRVAWRTILLPLFVLSIALIFGWLIAQEQLQDTPWWMAAPSVLAPLLIVFGNSLLKAPTLAGRKLLDDLMGFKMYLGTAEKHRFDTMQPPTMSLELFEAYLPYAFALGVEQTWSERFESEIPTESRSSYRSGFLHGTTLHALSSGAFSSQLSSQLSSTLSSGSGGGGSSGGGGGGGGGGGF